MPCPFCQGNWTYVFWLTDDYPVPIDFNIDDIHEAIKEALLRMGFDKVQPIRKFCDKNKRELCNARFSHLIPRDTVLVSTYYMFLIEIFVDMQSVMLQLLSQWLGKSFF